MKRISVFSAALLVMFVTGDCHADSLVITYRSGKTQTIILEEPSQTINSWQFVGAPQPEEPLQKNPVLQPESNSVPTEKTPEKKSGVRVKWNSKPISD
jgi:hypothetical protein